MSFQSQLGADLISVFFDTDDFARDDTYTTSTGATSTVQGILNVSQDLVSNPPGLAALGSYAVSKAQVADPKRYETITRSGVVWRIDEILQGDEQQWILNVSADHRAMPQTGVT